MTQAAVQKHAVAGTFVQIAGFVAHSLTMPFPFKVVVHPERHELRVDVCRPADFARLTRTIMMVIKTMGLPMRFSKTNSFNWESDAILLASGVKIEFIHKRLAQSWVGVIRVS